MDKRSIDRVTRIHLKTDARDRNRLIEFCLKNKSNQYLAIGWSHLYENEDTFPDYKSYYYAVKNEVSEYSGRINHALNVFWDAYEDDLFWTRDLDGNYWICRAKSQAIPFCNKDLDIGAVIPIEAYKIGIEVPGQIKASFNRPRGGIAEDIKDEIIVEYSKYEFNRASNTNTYEFRKIQGNIIENLPAFDLEELVIAYLQVKKDYYVLSNSIANKSTTVKIECKLIKRDIDNPQKAVVQVKGGNTISIDALAYNDYVSNGFYVYLYAPYIENIDKCENIERITREDLISFYREYRLLLPESITKWEDIFEEGTITED